MPATSVAGATAVELASGLGGQRHDAGERLHQPGWGGAGARVRESDGHPGSLGYLQLPAPELRRPRRSTPPFSAGASRGQASFEAPGLIGQFASGRAPAAEGGLLLWLDVQTLEVAFDAVRANGGTVLGDPEPDGPRRLATIRDPAGNELGIVEHG